MKTYSILTRSPELEPHHQMLFSVIPRTLIFLWEGCLTPIQGVDTVYSKFHQQGIYQTKKLCFHFRAIWRKRVTFLFGHWSIFIVAIILQHDIQIFTTSNLFFSFFNYMIFLFLCSNFLSSCRWRSVYWKAGFCWKSKHLIFPLMN